MRRNRDSGQRTCDTRPVLQFELKTLDKSHRINQTDPMAHPNGNTGMRSTGSGPSGTARIPEARKTCEIHGHSSERLIEILHDVQQMSGYVGEDSQAEIARCLNISKAEVHGIVSFYDDFDLRPGAHCTLRICRGEACQAMGAQELLDQAQKLTHEAGNIVAVCPVYCLGNCALSPALVVEKHDSENHSLENRGSKEAGIGHTDSGLIGRANLETVRRIVQANSCGGQKKGKKQ